MSKQIERLFYRYILLSCSQNSLVYQANWVYVWGL